MTDEPEGKFSLRDYFAAHAPITLDDLTASGNHHKFSKDMQMRMLAHERYMYADAMLKASKV